VVPDLGALVEDATRGLADDVLERGLFELGAFDQVVQVGDVGGVMLAVVVFEGLLGDMRARASIA